MPLPSTVELKRALEIKEKIEALEIELNQILGTKGAGRGPGRKAGGGGISDAGRARIAAAQKKRWAKLKIGAPAKKTTRRMSPAARAKIAAAARARWQKAKASGKNAL